MSAGARALGLVLVATAVAGCGGDDDAGSEPPSAPSTTAAATTGDPSGAEQRFPAIVGVEVTPEGDTFRFDVTVSSPYDTPERYADAWRVVAGDGTVLAVRELTHDHAAEQPFTRALSGVEIPSDVTTVTVEGRDLVNGWGGATQTVSIDR